MKISKVLKINGWNVPVRGQQREQLNSKQQNRMIKPHISHLEKLSGQLFFKKLFLKISNESTMKSLTLLFASPMTEYAREMLIL